MLIYKNGKQFLKEKSAISGASVAFFRLCFLGTPLTNHNLPPRMHIMALIKCIMRFQGGSRISNFFEKNIKKVLVF